MARLTLQLLPLILSVLYIANTAESTARTNFIKAACGDIIYPAVCVQSLSSHANEIGESTYQLARTAMTVSLAAAESAKANMLKLTKLKGLKPKEYGAMKDCIEETDASVDRLSQSLRELAKMGGVQDEEFLWHKNNVETWISAALTNVNTCVEGFKDQALEGKMKASVQGQVTNVEQRISNALVLFYQFATNH